MQDFTLKDNICCLLKTSQIEATDLDQEAVQVIDWEDMSRPGKFREDKQEGRADDKLCKTAGSVRADSKSRTVCPALKCSVYIPYCMVWFVFVGLTRISVLDVCVSVCLSCYSQLIPARSHKIVHILRKPWIGVIPTLKILHIQHVIKHYRLQSSARLTVYWVHLS